MPYLPTPPSVKTILRSPILWLILINFIIGFFTFRDYGMSQDEVGINALGQISLRAYQTLTPPKPKLFSGYAYDLIYYGPFYAMMTVGITKFLSLIFPFVRAVNFWHLSYFLAFQFSVFLIFRLAQRWFSRWTAITIALLFSTQPLLWGHAFINPKDIPFMAFFLASIESGLFFIDRHWNKPAEKNPVEFGRQSLQKIKAAWVNTPHPEKRRLITVSWLGLGLIILLWLSLPFVNRWLGTFIGVLYQAKPPGWEFQLFHRIAEQPAKVPLEHYIAKTQRWIIYGYVLLTMSALMAIGWRWLGAFGGGTKSVLAEILHSIRNLPTLMADSSLWLAAIVLGLTTSIRVGGPYAGALVCGLAIWRGGKKGILPSLVYLLLAGLVTYLTWPALWGDPVTHFIQSALRASHFPWEGKLLFMGQYWRADSLPWTYLPILLAIQFTEPVILLSLIGLIWLAVEIAHHRQIELGFLILFWLMIPILGIIIKRPPLYDNFRQLLFLVPPIFLLMGFPLQWLSEKIKPLSLRYALSLALILPGILGYFQLHPYEYAYYNSLVGGISGANNSFETEYWKTSFRKAIEYLDQTAEPHSKVLIWGAAFLVKEYARSDLYIQSKKGNSYQKNSDYDYVIVSYRNDKDEHIFPASPIIFSVQRQGVDFAVVKRIK